MTFLVDTNLHVIAPPELWDRYPLDVAQGRVPEWEIARRRTPESLIEVMDAVGVHQGFLLATPYHGFDNSYCADSALAYPDRFVSVANMDVLAPDAPATLRYWITQRGMHGVRFKDGRKGNERGVATWVDDEALDPVWRTVLELDVPCNAHTTTPATLRGTAKLLSRFPDLKLTLNNKAHVPASGGATSEAARDLLTLAKFRNTYVNLSVNFIRDAAVNAAASELMLALLDSFGPRRLLWTSFDRQAADEIGLPLQDTPKVLFESLQGLTAADRDALLGDGARDLYPSLRDRKPDS